jgi:uncharacterized delta-60 repeat protein
MKTLKLKLFFLAGLMVLALPFFINSQEFFIFEWAATYAGPSNNRDVPGAVATDQAGNVYVAGLIAVSGWISDLVLIKYDNSGTQKWVSTYDNGGWDSAEDMAVDSWGNIYVTGSSDNGSYRDYLSIKYDSSGGRLWTARYSRFSNSYSMAHAIAVDSQGNAYVTGGSNGYATIKYDSLGNQLWVAHYNGLTNSYDHAYAIALDSSGNVIVGGMSPGSGTGSDYATVKYDQNGNQLWAARYNGPANSSDDMRALAVDPAGNVCVTGYSMGLNGNYDFATVKYDNNGQLLWEARYNGPANGYDAARAIAIDKDGNIHVSGNSGTGPSSDIVVVKYNHLGQELWVTRYNGPGNGYDYAGRRILLDSEKNIYVPAASTGLGTLTDFLAIRLDPSGAFLHEARWDSPTHLSESASDMVFDPDGNIILTGVTMKSQMDWDITTAKFNVPVPPEKKIAIIKNTILSLSDDAFLPPAPKRKNALANKLNAVLSMIEEMNYTEAIMKLNDDVLAKMDGFHGGIPQNDWIIDKSAQDLIYPKVLSLINDLEKKL